VVARERPAVASTLGGGCRVDAEPVSTYVIREDGEVEWQPVFDLSSVIRRGQQVGRDMVALLVLWGVVRALRGR
jgi:hypothetical protein